MFEHKWLTVEWRSSKRFDASQACSQGITTMAHTFLCRTHAAQAADEHHIEFRISLDSALVERSETLGNAVAASEGADPANSSDEPQLILPSGAESNFFDDWKAVVGRQTDGENEAAATEECLVRGLQVCVSGVPDRALTSV
jgi:hypothetical protein